MSFYGNSLETTPFLDSMPTKSFTNYFASAVNTATAIPRVFAMTDVNNRANMHIENNITNIAKEAGLDTVNIPSLGTL